MQANPKSVEKLFNSQARYVVPMFQRHYVWNKDPQWSTLWEDVVEKAHLRLGGQQTHAHYLGAVIFEGVAPLTGNEVTRLLLIDGQQRVTTLQILLAAFRDYASARSWTTLARRANRLVENPDADVMENPEEEVFKVWPTQLNREIFTDVMLARSPTAVEEKYPLVRRKYQRKPDTRSPLVEAYLYFFRQIENWIEESEFVDADQEGAASALIQSIQQDLCVGEISLSEGDDSQEIFYSLNSQGRPLSQSDLLRSLIFMRAEKSKENRDELFFDFWRDFETPYWDKEVKRGGRTYSRLDIASRHFLTAKSGRLVDARRVNEEYRRWVESDPPPYESVRDELSDFTRYANVYKYHDESFAQQQAIHFGRVLQDFDVSTALPLVMFLELEAALPRPDMLRCTSALESFIVRRAICGEENKEYNKLFVEIIGTLSGLPPTAIPDALVAKLLMGGGTTRVWPTDEKLIERTLSAPLYSNLRQPQMRVILERLERDARTKKSETHDVQIGLQIEHVMPVRWSEHWQIDGQSVSQYQAMYPWSLGDEAEALQEAIRTRNTLVNTLGNLTLLNEYANPAASNGSFDLKLLEYRHSTLQLNRYFDTISSWSEESIRDRGRLLADRLCAIWQRPTSPSDTLSLI